MRFPSRLVSAAVAVVSCAQLHCATTSGATGEPDYASSAEANLKLGNESLDGRNYVEAEKYFEYVKVKYPFLDAAKEAEIRLADTDYERDHFAEARDRYQAFAKLHPTHPRVDYAAFRAALTHYKEIPSDFFLLPPSEEKDQVEVRGTLTAMADFVRQYPQSKFIPEAQKLVAESRKRLARHELYVAEFYAHRDRWAAVITRLNTVVKEYAGLGFDEEAYFGIYHAYQMLKDEVRAKESLRSIVQKLPGTPAATRAQKLLGAGG